MVHVYELLYDLLRTRKENRNTERNRMECVFLPNLISIRFDFFEKENRKKRSLYGTMLIIKTSTTLISLSLSLSLSLSMTNSLTHLYISLILLIKIDDIFYYTIIITIIIIHSCITWER